MSVSNHATSGPTDQPGRYNGNVSVKMELFRYVQSRHDPYPTGETVDVTYRGPSTSLFFPLEFPLSPRTAISVLTICSLVNLGLSLLRLSPTLE